ncbi:hypothetical protein AMJ40_05855 [candidate division TA06 bacterium DG_26]|uniref:Uncharacterized protein n=1 Tax=candidate division TA06 bacterium DG_26 TaxID=1703771 RepID=A0A0S7WGN7_UNCT6|nr:MAG: hypothetical protein AMJ40_05855 [candidate division TA06 bacterium DG_26]
MGSVIYLFLAFTVLFNLSYAEIAQLYVERGAYAEAITYLEKFFIENSYTEYPDHYLILGTCYFQLENYTRAESVLEKVFPLLASADQKVECLLMLGIISYARAEYSEAATIFTQALNLNTGRDAEVLLWLGKSEYNRGHHLEALEFLKRAQSTDSAAEISYWSGITLLRLERFEEADSVFSSLSRDRTWGTRSLLFRGYTLHLMGADEEANRIFHSLSHSQDSSRTADLAGIAYLHLGHLAMSEGNYEEAIGPLTAAKEVSSEPIMENALFRIGWCHYKQEEWEQAVEAFGIIVEERPESELWDRACYFMGEAQYRRELYSEALTLFRRLLHRAPHSKYVPHALYASAYCYSHLDSLPKAISQFEQYVDEYPESKFVSYARYRMGLFAYQIGDYSRAIRQLNALTRERVPVLSTEASYLIALSYYALSDHDSALDELKRLKTEENPLRAEAQKLLGDILFQKGDYWRAHEAYKQLSERYLDQTAVPSIVDEARYQMERSLLKLGLYSSPVTMLQAYIRKYPESSRAPTLQMELAQYYMETEQYYRAMEELERSLDLFAGRVDKTKVMMGLAKAYEELGFYERARDEYWTIDRKSPLAPRAWLSGANISFELEQFGRAITEYQTIVEEFKDTRYAEQALHMQAKCYISLGRYEEAKVIYEKSLSEYPKSSETEIFRFELALLALEEGLVEDALDMLDTEWSVDSLKGEALLQSGNVLLELGRSEEAVEKFLNASQYLSSDRKGEAMFSAGRSLELLGEDSRAYAAYQEALDVAVDERLRRKVLERMSGLEHGLKKDER